MSEVERQLEVIRRGTTEIISEADLKIKLENSLKQGKPLIIKAGFDPSAPDIHLGHTVLLRKMRHFQQLGHRVIFLIGDFTGMIGDPTGKSEIRRQLNREEVKENALTYERQIFRVLDPERTEIVFNSTWFEKMSSHEFLALAAHLTVAQILAREDFKQRYVQGRDISVLEFIYPLLQGYDSVQLKADVELGGTDQKFNLLVGRQMQKDYGQPQQVVLMMPLLEGLDGVQKMSKSLGNYIGINEPAEDMFGKLMSIPDALMYRYYELLTDISLTEIRDKKTQIEQGILHPKACKAELARTITGFYHKPEKVREAEELFEKRHGKKADLSGADIYVPFYLSKNEWKDGRIWICRLLTAIDAVSSSSEARRLISQKAVSLNNETITDPNLELRLEAEYLIRVGKKKFIRVITDEK